MDNLVNEKDPKGSVGRFFPTKSGPAVRAPNKKGRKTKNPTVYDEVILSL